MAGPRTGRHRLRIARRWGYQPLYRSCCHDLTLALRNPEGLRAGRCSKRLWFRNSIALALAGGYYVVNDPAPASCEMDGSLLMPNSIPLHDNTTQDSDTAQKQKQKMTGPCHAAIQSALHSHHPRQTVESPSTHETRKGANNLRRPS